VVRQAGREIGRTNGPPWTIDLPSLSSRDLDVCVVGLPINLFGPWHDPDHRWGVASPFMWMGDPIPTVPQPGSRYAQMDLGLLVSPRAVR
jgi:hypothetical protein